MCDYHRCQSQIIQCCSISVFSLVVPFQYFRNSFLDSLSFFIFCLTHFNFKD
ncbi:258R [Invertebrate iridescent virus Kaz2018]|nr:258R [Invertebrate iridescent virus Kaz2018]